MGNLSKSFCAVCKEGIIERIHRLISPIDGYFPAELVLNNDEETLEFGLDLIPFSPVNYKVEWILNTKTLAEENDTININSSMFLNGMNQLTVTVYDTTEMVRTTNHKSVHGATVQWEINNSVLSVSVNNSTESKFELDWFPNPVQKELTIRSLNDQLIKKVEVFNLSGKQVFESENKKSSSSLQINLAQLIQGEYLLLVQLDNGARIVQKLIKE